MSRFWNLIYGVHSLAGYFFCFFSYFYSSKNLFVIISLISDHKICMQTGSDAAVSLVSD